MLCCKELNTPLNSASVVVPGGENGFLFISSKSLVQEVMIKPIIPKYNIFFIVLNFSVFRFPFQRFTFKDNKIDLVPG